VLGYADSEYVALRENVAFLRQESRPATPSVMTRSQELGTPGRVASSQDLSLR